MGIPDFTVETNVVPIGSGKKKVLECTIRSFLTTMTFRVTASVGELLSFEKYAATTAGGNFTIALNKNLTVNVRGNAATLIRGSTGFDLVIRMEWCHTVDLARSLYAAAKSNDDRVGREKAKPKVPSKGKAPETESDSDSDEAPEPKLDTKRKSPKRKSPESDSESEEEGFAPREGIKAIFKTLNGCGTSTGYILAYPESTLSAAGGVVVQPPQVILSYTREDALATFPYGNTTGPYAPLKCTAHYKSESLLTYSIAVLNVTLAGYESGRFKAVLGESEPEVRDASHSDCGTLIAGFEIVDLLRPAKVAAPKVAPKPPAKKGAPKNKPAPKVEDDVNQALIIRGDIYNIFDTYSHSTGPVVAYPELPSVNSVPNFLPHQVLLTYSATTATETFTGAGPYSRLRCRAYYTSRDALVKGIAELNTKLADYKSGRFKAVVAGFGGDDWASFEVRDLKP